MLRILDALVAHTNGRFNEVVHFVLLTEVPSMSFVPHAGDQLAAIQKASTANFWCWVYFVPNHELEGVIGRIKSVVPILGKDHYLGPHGSKASHMVYDRLISEYLATGRKRIEPAAGHSITVVEVLASYLQFAKTYYLKNGKPTNELDALRLIVNDAGCLYGNSPASEFGPKALKVVRQLWLERGQARRTINKNMRRLTRIFKWAASEELIPVAIYQALVTVPG